MPMLTQTYALAPTNPHGPADPLAKTQTSPLHSTT